MGLLGRFDLSTDFTQFFVGLLALTMLFAVLMTWVAPKGGRRRGRGRVDDRFRDTDGDLID